MNATAHETDVEWEKWGARDPYFGVLTHERFRSTALTAAAFNDFFASGRDHVEAVLATCRRHYGDDFRPRRVLDFGCGVGRVLIPFTEVCEHVTGVDVSESMLAEARRNCARFGVTNAELVRGDDRLCGVDGRFDLVHSTIVLQHIEAERGMDIVARLVERLAPGGVASLHVTYGRDWGRHRYGRPIPDAPEPPPPPRTLYRRLRSTARAILLPHRSLPPPPAEPPPRSDDPVMMMYHYEISRLAYVFHAAGAAGFHAEFTDHGGELGATLYARAGERPVDPPATRTLPTGPTADAGPTHPASERDR